MSLDSKKTYFVKDLIGIMSRWTIFGLQILYAHWLNLYSNLILALLLLHTCRLLDDIKKAHVHLYMKILTSSICAVSSLKRTVSNSNTNHVSILVKAIKSEVDNL